MSPDEIVDAYSSLTLSDVYAALAYYFENRAHIDREILQSEELAEQLRGGQPSIIEKARRRLVANAADDTVPPR